MEFRDLNLQYKQNKQAINDAIQGVLESGQYIGGSPVVELERQLASYVGVKHCITCANGTDALQLALMAWGVGAGDAVFVPDFTFFATAEVIPCVGATPVFVDVEEDTFNISVKSLKTAIEKVMEEGKLSPKVVIAVDLFGQPADYLEIRKLTEKYGLLLLEDGAQGFGGSINGKMACSFGDISTTSFFPAKPLGCYGDGGAIFTDNDEWAELINSYKVHGKGSDKYDNIRIGMNSRLDTIQAAVLIEKFKIFRDYELNAVNQVAEWYTRELKDTRFICPMVKDGYTSSWAQYTIRLPESIKRDSVQEYLREHNIPTMVYYMKPMHLQSAFEKTEAVNAGCLNAEKLSQMVLSLPMHPYLAEEEARQIIQTLKEYKI